MYFLFLFPICSFKHLKYTGYRKHFVTRKYQTDAQDLLPSCIEPSVISIVQDGSNSIGNALVLGHLYGTLYARDTACNSS